MKTKILRLSLVISLLIGLLMSAYPVKAEVTPWPVTDFWNDPAEPSIFDWTTFGLYGYAPENWTCVWNFGNGITYDQCFAYQAARYEQDGDYTVSVQVTDEAGQVSSASRTISVRTHEIAITSVAVPQSARAGQTRQIVVYVRNSRYTENVMLDLWKSTASGYTGVGSLTQFVPVRSANRTTAFKFSYTFTAEDARTGKVTFKAIATLLDHRDALPADNEVITLPIRVFR